MASSIWPALISALPGTLPAAGCNSQDSALAVAVISKRAIASAFLLLNSVPMVPTLNIRSSDGLIDNNLAVCSPERNRNAIRTIRVFDANWRKLSGNSAFYGSDPGLGFWLVMLMLKSNPADQTNRINGTGVGTITNSNAAIPTGTPKIRIQRGTQSLWALIASTIPPNNATAA